MIVKHAKDIARTWVTEEASGQQGFFGAYISGSINWLPDDAQLPTSSDLDVVVVLDQPDLPGGGKFPYRGLMFDIAYSGHDAFQSSEAVLGNYVLAGHWTKPCILSDPSGQLTAIQPAVIQEYPRRHWVRKRCRHAHDSALTCLDAVNSSDSVPEQIISWFLGLMMSCHMVLVADLRNPTVVKCLVASQQVLAQYEYLLLHESMLDILGSSQMTREHVIPLFNAYTAVFDIAASLIKTPFPFSTNIRTDTRMITIDGIDAQVERGYHREAVLWILALHSLCQQALQHDAPSEVLQQSLPSYVHLLHTIRIDPPTHLEQRVMETRQLLPRIWKTCEAIVEANPLITD